jgi:hypothetical protein
MEFQPSQRHQFTHLLCRIPSVCTAFADEGSNWQNVFAAGITNRIKSSVRTFTGAILCSMPAVTRWSLEKSDVGENV